MGRRPSHWCVVAATLPVVAALGVLPFLGAELPHVFYGLVALILGLASLAIIPRVREQTPAPDPRTPAAAAQEAPQLRLRARA